jgi:DNA-binding GntR family transcriptional regulator
MLFLLRKKFRIANSHASNGRMRDRHRQSTLGSRVYQDVRRRILSGALPPGQPMSRRRIAIEMRTSLLPAAHALQRLEFEGLLESRPRAGTRVRIPSREDMLDQFVVREALEVQAATRAALLAAPLELEHLATLARQLDEACGKLDPRQYSALHRDFHRQVAAYSQCDPLCEAVDRCHAFATLWLSRVACPAGNQIGHQRLVEAIASRDPGQAADAVTQHLAFGAARVLEALAIPTESGAPAKPFRRRRRGPAWRPDTQEK